MDKFLEGLGKIVVAGTLFIIAIVTVIAGFIAHEKSIVLSTFIWGLPIILGGVMLAAFGSMLGQLKAIRVSTERQADLMQQILDRRLVPKTGLDISSI